jgi:hypothetical protein
MRTGAEPNDLLFREPPPLHGGYHRDKRKDRDKKLTEIQTIERVIEQFSSLMETYFLHTGGVRLCNKHR